MAMVIQAVACIKNLVFNQPPTHSNRYKEWLDEKGYEIPEVSRAYFGDNPHLRVQELCGLLSGTKEQTIPYFIIMKRKVILVNHLLKINRSLHGLISGDAYALYRARTLLFHV